MGKRGNELEELKARLCDEFEEKMKLVCGGMLEWMPPRYVRKFFKSALDKMEREIRRMMPHD